LVEGNNLEAIARNIVEQYYNMDEGQRIFILGVIKLNPDWSKLDYMKALLLFNKMDEFECGIGDDKLDAFIGQLDEKCKELNYWLRKYDNEFLNQRGII
jgi:hypothetical protein